MAWQELESALPLEAVTLGAQLAHLAGANVILDPSLRISLPDELMHVITLIKPNAREAKALTGFQVTDRNSARKAGKQLLERGVGNEGNLIITPDNEYWFPKLPMQNIDATRAGDAFAAALTVALLEERPWQEVGYYGQLRGDCLFQLAFRNFRSSIARSAAHAAPVNIPTPRSASSTSLTLGCR